MKPDFASVMKLLKKETSGFTVPALTEISGTRDPYKVLVSCVLSLRTKDATTAAASERLFALADTPGKMLRLTEKSIREAIYPVGFYRTKARNIRRISKILLDAHGGRVPGSMEKLLELPNVGRKTANIVLVFGFRKEGLPIDTHCHRIPNRLGWVRTRTPDETEIELRRILPKRHWQDFNDIFVKFGQNLCRPVSPRCWECPITMHCRYYRGAYLKKRRT